ncbi:MAG TPA: hypothetical protein VHV47_12875 [Opitutaceae bacterium]|jgi:hypothetical protein|nr:hypothetical protein [Opitutaceae bacterium]
MSDDTSAPRARYGWIRPGWFLAGFLGGAVALAALGWKLSRTDYHPGFERFYAAISPETNYFPTLDEMKSIVRARCRKDQVLVVVGGNSVLLGVWQPRHEIWTLRLQELLGPGYCVVDFAFSGASPTDGGAVLAESLRKEYPRQIYIADEAPLTGVASWGAEVYRYLFWQAYFSGQLLPDAVRDGRVKEFREADPANARLLEETRISLLFNAALHYRDLWNWVTFRHFSTVARYPGEVFPTLLRSRAGYPDAEGDATDPQIVAQRYPASVLDIELRIVRGADLFYHSRDASGRWVLAEATRGDVARRSATAFPDSLKKRTLMLFGHSSPYYRRMLTPDEAARENQSFLDTVELWRASGYPAMQFGRDFTDDDYGDRIHLSKLGGAKLAAAVAPEVRELAARLGYLR